MIVEQAPSGKVEGGPSVTTRRQLPHEAAAPTVNNGKAARIPVLDGFRALAITMVLLKHGEERTPAAAAHALSFLAEGLLGVRIFFVLSGYLITRLLKAELQRTGTISLRKFYARRALRILPAYLTFVVAMVWAPCRSVQRSSISESSSPWLGCCAAQIPPLCRGS
jgi:peptidoglycan/LPS O-acetylase OafA/YrhL